MQENKLSVKSILFDILYDMTSPESVPEKLYDWNIPLTEVEREELLIALDQAAADDAELNDPASRPPLPASYTAARILRKRRRYKRTHSHD